MSHKTRTPVPPVLNIWNFNGFRKVEDSLRGAGQERRPGGTQRPGDGSLPPPQVRAWDDKAVPRAPGEDLPLRKLLIFDPGWSIVHLSHLAGQCHTKLFSHQNNNFG